MSLDLFWWRHRRPSVHIADVPLDPEKLPWFKRPRLAPLLAANITYHEPDPERVRNMEPVKPVGGNLLEIERARRCR